MYVIMNVKQIKYQNTCGLSYLSLHYIYEVPAASQETRTRTNNCVVARRWRRSKL